MPKIRPLTESQANRLRLKENLELIQGNRSDKDMGEIMGISAATYYRRKNDPTSLTLAEIWRMCKESGTNIADFVGNTLKIGV